MENFSAILSFILGALIMIIFNRMRQDVAENKNAARAAAGSEPTSSVDPKKGHAEQKQEELKQLPTAAQVKALVQFRRSVFPKDFDGGDVPKAVINELLHNGTWAPSHGKTEPWRFVVLGRDAIQEVTHARVEYMEEKLQDDPAKLAAFRAKMKRKAPDVPKISHAIVIIMQKKATSKGKFNPEWEEVAAVASAVQNMHLTLAVHTPYCGYWSSCGVDSWLLHAPRVRTLLSLAPGERPLGLFKLGRTQKYLSYRATRQPVGKISTWVE